MIDIHNHLLVSVDDGPSTEEEALDLLKQAKDNGISKIIVTPHHLSGDYFNEKSKTLSDLESLKSLIFDNNLEIEVFPGQEIRINGDLVDDLENGKNLTLNNSRYILIELPFTEVPSYIDKMFFDLQLKGYTPVIAHPERCRTIKKNPNILFELVEKGAIAQITASSVVGSLGESMQEVSLEMIENNLIHFVGSDAHHAENRPFMLKEAYEVIAKELGQTCVNDLQNNAEAILHNNEVKVKAPQKFEEKTKTKRKKFFGLF